MKHFYPKALALSALCGGLLTACVDDGYDLSDIDTTTEVKVDNLTIPVNLDPVKMASIIDLEDNETVQLIDGQYCIVREDEFNSDPIKIDPVTLTCDALTPSSKVFDLSAYSGVGLPAGAQAELDLSAAPSPFDISTSSTPDCIAGIDEASLDMNVTMTLSLRGFGSNLKGFRIDDIRLILPKGLKEIQGPGSYNEQTGIYSIAHQEVTGSSVALKIKVNRINFADAGVVFNAADHTINFAGALGVENADAMVRSSDLVDPSQIPASITYMTEYHIDPIAVHTFSGSFSYDVEDLDIPRVNLGDIPDVLSQEGTSIALTNPQLYLSFNNPVAQYGITGEIDLDIRAVRGGQPSGNCRMDSPLYVAARSNSEYCLSPSKPESYPVAFANAEYHPYSSLGKVIEGDGIPSALDIEVINPELNGNHVKDFPLGTTLPAVTGKYYLFAPLALAAGSQIAYTSDMDGWWDEDLDKLLIKEMTVTAEITSDVPVSLDFTGYPIDRDGRQIGDVQITGANVPAKAQNYKIELKITGAVQGIDGIRYKAVAAPKPGEDASALREDMSIIISNVRATVSGSYTTDF